MGVGLAVALVLLVAWEGVLRQFEAPFEPVAHQPARWQANYSEARGEPARVVFLGTSRTRCGIVPSEVGDVLGLTPGQVVNLGIDNTSPLPVLDEMLAEGWSDCLIVIEVMPGNFFARPVVKIPALQATPVWERPNAALLQGWRENTRLSNQELRPLTLAHEAARHWAGKARHPLLEPSLVLHADHWLEFRPHDDATTRSSPQVWFRRYTPLREPALVALLARLKGQVAALKSVGVEVVFLRMPSRDWWAQQEKASFPRERYWDRLVGVFPGRCLWVGEPPLALDLSLPDGSHLDGPSARCFSRALGVQLQPRLGR